ncbi:MAG: polymerase sigma factor FliA [Halanaerobiales bacterium]|nr:polymerase sigma factor FliA [Halanaerobiales bacterium]
MSEKKIENYTLWQEFKDHHNEEARQELILKYLPLVKYQVGRIKMVVPGFIEEDDLESYGIIGLIDAINKFDYRQEIKFESYASRRIRGEIIDHLRRLDWLPHSLRRDAKQLQETAERLAGKLGRKPTVNELADALNISRDKVNQLYYQIYSSQWISLFDQKGDIQLFEIFKEDSDKGPEKHYQQKERENLLAEAIDRLSEAERLVISLYYYEELTQKEIARVMGLSPARISQLHKRAVYRLRGMLSRKKEQLV